MTSTITTKKNYTIKNALGQDIPKRRGVPSVLGNELNQIWSRTQSSTLKLIQTRRNELYTGVAKLLINGLNQNRSGLHSNFAHTAVGKVNEKWKQV
jgi:hypothetical protein